MSMYALVHVHLRVCMSVYAYIVTCVYVYKCVQLYMCVLCVLMYMGVCTHVHTIHASVPDFPNCMQFIIQLPLSCCYAKQSVFNGGN